MATSCTISPAEIRTRRAVTGTTSASTIIAPSATTRPMGCQSSAVEVSAAAKMMQARTADHCATSRAAAG
jgi:hypothetical protein